MRNKFTLVLMALTIVISGILTTTTADAAKRKVVLEDHTGAWCGHCPRGMETLEKLENQYGEMIIGVGVHNGDRMATNYQDTLKSMIGVTGYPNGSVNRVMYNGKIAQSDGVWKSLSESLVNTDVPVGVSLDVDYDKSTGDYTVTITADVEVTITDQLAWNLWILEDYVTGSGQGWDQTNYKSKYSTVDPDPNSKWYEYPAQIPNFLHMDVFRKAHGGTKGDKSGFNVPISSGKYTKTYTGNVSEANVQNKNNVFFVGVVHNTSNLEIINADRVGKIDKELDTLLLSVNNPYTSVPTNDAAENEITITNIKDYEISANLTIEENTSLIPEGWNVTLENNSVVVPANSSVAVKLNVEKNSIEGFAQINVKVLPNEVENHIPIVDNTTTYFMSENIQHAYLYNYDDGAGPVFNSITSSGEFENVSPVVINSGTLTNFPQMKNFKTAIITIDDATFGLTTASTLNNLKYIEELMDKGTDLLIASCYDLINYGEIFSNLKPTPEAKSFFENRIGVKLGTALIILNQQTGQLATVNMLGVSGDPISNGLNFNYNNVYSQNNYPFYATYFSTVSLNGKTNATAFLEANTNLNGNLNTTNNKIGIKLDNNGQRTALFTFSLDPMGMQNLNTVMKSTLDWLKDGSSAGPSLSLNVSQVKFGEIEVEETASETVQISNKGDEKLSITEINLLKGTNFEVKAGSLPITIDPGQTVNLTIEFTPSAKQNYTDEITFVSNDSENSETVLPVQGTGKLITSVPGQILNVFSMNVVPNPVTDNSVVNFNVKEGSSNVKLVLIDATGKVVSNLYDNVASGNQKVDLNASQLSSGSYYINADVDGITTQLPVVITK